MIQTIFQGEKYGLHYRLVEESDAEFIVKLRTDKTKSRFLHPVSSDVFKQIEWIKKYKQREKEEKDFYYVFSDDSGNKLGLGRLYNITEQTFTSGSWIFISDAFFGASIFGDIIIRELGFDKLKKKTCLFDVCKGNIQVIKYHMRYNPIKIGEDELNYYFELNQEVFNKGKSFYLNLLKVEEK